MNTETETCSLPEAKLLKASFVIGDEALDPGIGDLLIHTVQVLRGNLQYWLLVLPCLRTELAACNRLLGMTRVGGPLVVPRGDAAEAEAAPLLAESGASRLVFGNARLDSLVGVLLGFYVKYGRSTARSSVRQSHHLSGCDLSVC